jgi:hypothetical protein
MRARNCAFAAPVCAPRSVTFDFVGKKQKRGQPRIRTAAYSHEYYALKQREWRAAHPRPKKLENKDNGANDPAAFNLLDYFRLIFVDDDMVNHAGLARALIIQMDGSARFD